MDEQAAGIVLRVRPLTETSLIVEWITREAGRISCVAKGARRPKSAFLGKLDLFYEGQLSFQRSRRSDLHILKEVVLRDTRPRLRESLPMIHAAAYMTVLIEQGTERETPITEFYELLREALGALPGCPSVPILIWAFELKFLGMQGMEPDFNAARLIAEARALGSHLPQIPFEGLNECNPSARAKEELNSFLRTRIGTALERLPPQREKALHMNAL